MFKKKIEDEEILSKMYDFILDTAISERERKIGMMAKKDLERGKYTVAVVNKFSISLQREAMKNGLTPTASDFYHVLESILNEIAPFGTNRGSSLSQNSYLN
ncbi:hypothetical protein JCM15457_2061 [Liquorilactobacillus sucicola DSM 21376 = JCM 15457]|uniref:Gar-IM n=1 Tax=Liquorilactobacillus sucicola DSM 21376 = JCM 15457 TaxID=1423806 RepID=A0A023CZ49_9LACO|nr:bacteriocin immunity protein [Liquorilactobacillus sucicola]KRN06643.1 hypothetical protein FD15_GL000193 [Liquorilactobacillus sucicola DSM 21376 = JCM 15457]GAJ27099.1 hypothetical protein JCM15457_2061 [Liquorilactobacillus sucicola DSM 21376 = JCM 15457]